MKRKDFDCVHMKREVQRPLSDALAGKTPEQQAATLTRLAARNPIWQRLIRRSPKSASGGRA
jgi:hypothetical protein